MSLGAKQTILITGGTGFLGSHLVRHLVRQEHRIILLRRISSNTSRLKDVEGEYEEYNIEEVSLERIFRENSIDMILHCATHYGRSEPSPIPIIEANLVLPLTLLHLAISHGVKQFVNTDSVLDPRTNQYSTSKKQFLEWLKTYADRITCINVALEHFFGAGDDPSKFVSNIVTRMLQNEKIIELSPGDQRRDFVYIDDVVDGFMRIIEWGNGQPKGFSHFEVGTGMNISIRQFVELVKKLIGNCSTELKFGAIPYRNAEVMESRVDLVPISALGYRPKVSLEEGLRKTIEGERGRTSS